MTLTDFKSRVLVAIILSFLWPVAVQAQQAVLQNLHAKGYLGLGYSRNASGNAVGTGWEKEFSTELRGAVFHPDFISFGSSFSLGHSTSSISTASFQNTAWAASNTLMVLPATLYPLLVTYQRTRVGLGNTRESNATNSDRLKFDWHLKLNSIPRINVGYEKSSSWSEVPLQAFVAAGSHNSGFNVNATDEYKGWNWFTSWMQGDSQTGVLLLDTPAEFTRNYSTFGGTVAKRYYRNQGTFIYNFSRSTSATAEGSLSESHGRQTLHGLSTAVLLTPKLTTSGSFQFYNYSSEGKVATPSAPDDFTFFVSFPGRGCNTNGNIIYRLHPRVSLSNSTAYSVVRVAPGVREQATRFFTNAPSISANYNWNRFYFSASYGLQYQATGTSTERWFTGLSNNVSLNTAWSHPAGVSLNGSFTVGHAATAVLPGSYSDTRNYSITAETSRLRRVGFLRFSWQLRNRSLLGATGFLENRESRWSVMIRRPRFQVEGGASSGDGVHLAFDEVIESFQPLPPLLGVPFLNDSATGHFVSAGAVLSRNLQLHGTYRKTINEILPAVGEAHYSVLEIAANYRIGKITVDASYGHYLNFSEKVTSQFRSSADRFRFRIRRTFSLL